MANVLKVSHQEAIRSLHGKGWTQRRIACELGLHRQTVGRYIEAGSKCTTISTPGSGKGGESKCITILTPGCGGSPLGARAANSSAGTLRRKSQCEPFAATVCAKLEAGLSAQRIYQDIAQEQPVLLSEGGGPNGVFLEVIVYLSSAVFEIDTQEWPVGKRVVDSLAKGAAR